MPFFFLCLCAPRTRSMTPLNRAVLDHGLQFSSWHQSRYLLIRSAPNSELSELGVVAVPKKLVPAQKYSSEDNDFDY